MSNSDAERRRLALRRVISHLNETPASWARAAGLPNGNTIYNFLKGDSNSLSNKTLEALAACKQLTVSQLLGETPLRSGAPTSEIEVRGEVQAGMWREALEYPLEDRFTLTTIINPPKYKNRAFGLKNTGESMNEFYMDGDILICIRTNDLDDGILANDHVIVQRTCADGLCEATCKEVRVNSSGRAFLVARSTDPEFQDRAIPIPWPYDPHRPAPDGTEHVEISAVVVGSHRSRRRGR